MAMYRVLGNDELGTTLRTQMVFSSKLQSLALSVFEVFISTEQDGKCLWHGGV
jgi:hypothetical protein